MNIRRRDRIIERPTAVVGTSSFGKSRLENIMRTDVSLTYRLLRFINSAWFGLRRPIESVRHALVWLGTREIQKWVALVCLRSMSEDKPNELVVRAVARARMGELMSTKVGMGDHAPDLFMMGMFSMLDSLLDTPMQEILAPLPVNEQIKAALLEEPCQFRRVFDTILAYERADWSNFPTHATEIRLDEKVMPGIFTQSVEWAAEAFASAEQ